MTLSRIMQPLPDDQQTHTITLKARYDGFRVLIQPVIRIDGEEIEI